MKQLNLFTKPEVKKSKDDYLKEIKVRLEILNMRRQVIDEITPKPYFNLNYSIEGNCLHKTFRKLNSKEYKCVNDNCKGIITVNQINFID